MSFNDQVENTTSSGFKSSTFLPGVKFKMLNAKSALVFRILPAFDPNDLVQDQSGASYINPMGFLPFRNQDGTLTDWGCMAYFNRFVGHGNYKDGTRRDFVATKTFEKDNDNVFDPYVELQRRASADPDWNYLIKDKKDPNTNMLLEGATLPKTQSYLLINIIDVNEPDAVRIGALSTGACKSLVGKDVGIASQRAGNVTEEQIRANYITEWAVGDLTHPVSGPVLVAAKGTDKGEMSGYFVNLKLDATSRVQRWPLNPPSLLGGRYNIADPRSILVELSPEDTVKELVRLLNTRSPRGYHEWALLREVFGGIYGNLIPEPPTASAATATVGGFGANPADNTATAATRPESPVVNANIPAQVQVRIPAQSAPTAPTAHPAISAAPAVTNIPPNVPGMVNKPFSASDFYKRNSAGK